MSYLKVTDFLLDVSESNDADIVSAALYSIRGIVRNDHELIMGIVHAVHHVDIFGQEESLNPLLKGLSVRDRYPNAMRLSEKAMDGDNSAVMYWTQMVIGTVTDPLDVARIFSRAIVSTESPECHIRIIRILDSLIRQKKGISDKEAAVADLNG